MADRHGIPGVRRSRALILAGALAVGAAGSALAQSSTTPPPLAPSAVPAGGTIPAPADPGGAPSPAGQNAGRAIPDKPDAGTPPLQNDAAPAGITKAGQ